MDPQRHSWLLNLQQDSVGAVECVQLFSKWAQFAALKLRIIVSYWSFGHSWTRCQEWEPGTRTQGSETITSLLLIYELQGPYIQYAFISIHARTLPQLWRKPSNTFSIRPSQQARAPNSAIGGPIITLIGFDCSTELNSHPTPLQITVYQLYN